MAIKVPQRLVSGIDVVDRFMGSVSDSFRALADLWPFFDGVLVDVPAATTSTERNIYHRLGRMHRGFIVVAAKRPTGATADIRVFERPGSTAEYLTLYTHNSFETLKIWVW